MHVEWWGHSDPTFCNQIHLNFLHSEMAGRYNIPLVPLVQEPSCETFTTINCNRQAFYSKFFVINVNLVHSIPTWGNIFLWIFCFYIVKPLLPILALLPYLCISKKLYSHFKNQFTITTTLHEMQALLLALIP